MSQPNLLLLHVEP